MKKVTLIFAMLVLALGFGVAQAHAALPVVDGAIGGATEWDNVDCGGGPYAYYLDVADPNELDVPNAYDITRVVLLQELSSVSGDGDTTNDGIYILLETVVAPSLVDPDGSSPRAPGRC